MSQTIIFISLAIVIFLIGVSFGRMRHSLHPQVKSKMDSNLNKGNNAVKERIEKRKSRIMAVARKNGTITNDEVEDLFFISDDTVRRYLNDLEQAGELTQVGETGRGVYYTPN